MRTYVRMTFHSEGANPLKVLETMKTLGFEESNGMHDYVYKWKEKASLDEIIRLMTVMQERL